MIKSQVIIYKGMKTMRNLLYILLLSIAMSSHVYASQYDIFVGAEAGLSWADFNGPNGKYQNHEITTYGIKSGIVNHNTRLYLSYNYMDAYADSTSRDGAYHTLTANTEAMTGPVNIFGIVDLAFFVGGHAGGININVDADFGQSDKYALLYGVQAGVLARFDSIVSLEAGYRFSYSSFSDQNTDLDKLQVAYGGINFKF